jgi:hypothetical protein
MMKKTAEIVDSVKIIEDLLEIPSEEGELYKVYNLSSAPRQISRRLIG